MARSETPLYVKFQLGIEVSWIEVNPAGAKFLEIVAVYVSINMDMLYGKDIPMRKLTIYELGCRNI